ncbi:MAG: isoprenylcysteine carboxylmethyltransferase family protein [Bacteroidota bacterium]
MAQFISNIFLALRSMMYATVFVFLWGWLAVETRRGLGEWFTLPSFTRWIGLFCFVLGGALALWCILQFFLFGKGTPAPFDAPTNLVRTGPYKYVRNPMYVGGAIVLLGFGLWNTSTTMALFTIFFLLLAHFFVVLYEEPALEREFGPDYLLYKTAVSRWIPKSPGQAA